MRYQSGMDTPPPDMATIEELTALLRWYMDAGVDWALDDAPHDRFVESASESARRESKPATASVLPGEPLAAQTRTQLTVQEPAAHALQAGPSAFSASPTSGSEFSTEAALRSARELAAAATDLDALKMAFGAFDGCGLKRTATQLVFSDGDPHSRVMLIGEAPGAEEDRAGLPFVGRAGKLLDRMLTSIGLDRSMVYIANVVPWRPPGNRTPTPQETTICRPFVLRQIALAKPDILVTLGGAATQAVLGVKEGIMRARGSWRRLDLEDDQKKIAALATLHPAYLLRSPAAKRLAWRDLREIRKALDKISS